MRETIALRESRLRSILKAATYRVAGTATTVAITYAITGEAATALAIGGLEPFVKTVVYYLHERVWQQVPVGTVRRLAARYRRLRAR